jgi:hypothetical protein
VKDPEIATPVVEIVGTNAASNFITCPQDHASVLAVRLPMFYMLVKSVRRCAKAAPTLHAVAPCRALSRPFAPSAASLRDGFAAPHCEACCWATWLPACCAAQVDARPFFFEVQVLDDKNIRRRFRASNFQGTTRVKPFICGMPLKLVAGWNTILFDLPTLTMKAFGALVRTSPLFSASSCLDRPLLRLSCRHQVRDGDEGADSRVVPSAARVLCGPRVRAQGAAA